VDIQIVGTDLPGRAWTGEGERRNVHVGVQRRNAPGDLLELRAADAPAVTWTLECTVDPARTPPDVTGPYVQGGPGGRFIYLSWGTVDGAGAFAMFRRAKLMLADVPPEVMAAAMATGRLVGRLRLTDSRGGPICARVRPPLVRWTAETGT
jgi:Family of unknown function (DUF5990)